MTWHTPAVDLTDGSLFSGNRFWSVFARLRREAPVFRHTEPDGPGFWVLSTYQDIVSVYADHETWSSRHGMRLESDPVAIEAVSQRMLIVSDPPDHTHLKRVLSQAFGPTQVEAWRRRVGEVVDDVLDRALEAGQVDVVDLVRRIPNYVVCELMGIPREDWEWIGDLTTGAFESDDGTARSSAHGEIFLYFTDLLAERRRRPRADLVTLLATERRQDTALGGQRPLTDEEIVFNCNGILAGANETTRYTASGAVLALIENPDQWQALRSGEVDVATAAEEVLRWTTPGVHALRTATRPTSIRGIPIAAGDRVTLWNVSANRDESVFPGDGDRFRLDRTPNRHIAFGHGRHLCLGARLGRLELNAFLAALVRRVDGLELTGRPTFNDSNFTWGLNHLPVRLTPTRSRARATATVG